MKAFVLKHPVDQLHDPGVVILRETPEEAAQAAGGELGEPLPEGGWKVVYRPDLFSEPPAEERERFEDFLIFRHGPVEVLMNPGAQQSPYLLLVEAPLIAA